MPVTLVCGPPCAGKSTFVRSHAGESDLVVEHDDIAVMLGSRRSHGHDFMIGREAEVHVQRLIGEIAAGLHPDAWVTRTMPEPGRRAQLAEVLGGAEVVVLVEPRDVLVARAMQRPNPKKTVAAIDRWLAAYRP